MKSAIKGMFYIFILIICMFTCGCSNNKDSPADVNSSVSESVADSADENSESDDEDVGEITTTTTTAITEITTDEEKTESTTSTTTIAITTITTTSQVTTKATTTTSKLVTTTAKPTTTTTTTTTTSKPISSNPIDKAKFKVSPIKAKYTSSATALACIQSVLEYYGYSCTQEEMVNYLTTNSEFYEENGKTYGPNPIYYFVGDPTNTIYGSGAIPISEMLQKYLEAKNIDIYFESFFNTSFNLLTQEISNDNFVIVWIIDDPNGIIYYDKDLTFGGDTAIIWPTNIRCMLVIGTTSNSVILSDPSSEQIIEMSRDDYESNVFDQCIIIG